MFFFKQGDRKPDENSSIIAYYENRKLDEIEKQLEISNDYEFNKYDWSCIKGSVFHALLEKGFSIEWIYKTDFTEIFFEYSVIRDNNLILEAEQWARYELQDIETKINAKDVKTGDEKEPYRERTEAEKEVYRAKLYSEKFIKKEEKL